VAYERRDSPYFQPPQLFASEHGMKFTDRTDDGGPYFSGTRSGRGAAVVDLDNNGALDLVVVHQNDRVAVLLNRHSPESWLTVKLVGTSGDRTAVGAVAEVAITGRTVKRWTRSGGSYLSQSDSRLLFQLPSDDPVDITITWLGGHRETFRNLSPNTCHTLVEGQPRL
jgi:enediyne biosynthesis protein E4